MKNENVDVLVLGGGTAGSNTARSAIKAGAKRVVMVHPENLTNTCVEEGCMPSKSILAGAHQKLSLTQVIEERNEHITRLMKALTEGFETEQFEVVIGEAKFTSNTTVEVTQKDTTATYEAKSIVIATGSVPSIPPIPGLDTSSEKIIVSDDVVSKKANLKEVPKKVLTIGGGPIGLELSTFFHDMGSEVLVLQRKAALGLFDSEFGEERVRASCDKNSFPIHLNCNLTKVEIQDTGVMCTIDHNGEVRDELFDIVLVATGRRPNIADIGLENTDVTFDERKGVIHNKFMETESKGIFIAGDVTGHHQILHFATEMGKVAGHNAVGVNEKVKMDYDRHMLAVSFDQFPSALIGMTENEATKRGIEVITATKHFNSIGLGILKRQEYGMWKVVADKKTGVIIGSQILGPDSAGELIQVLTPIIANKNTYGEVLEMTWYHPTYAEILKSIVRDMCKEDIDFSPGM